MVGKGYNAWPDKSEADIRDKTQGLSGDEIVGLMTYGGDMYSWFAGSVTAEVYFCPERHGTYYGSFYIKDAPAVGHPGYSIDETTTATLGRALTDSTLGSVSGEGAKIMNTPVDAQKSNLFTGATANMVGARTKISKALRGLITSTAPTAATLIEVQAVVDSFSRIYGELDGQNNYAYPTTFSRLYNNLDGTCITPAQKAALAALRKKVMTVTYADGSTIDYSTLNKFYLYASELSPTSADLVFYTSDASTDQFFKRF